MKTYKGERLNNRGIVTVNDQQFPMESRMLETGTIRFAWGASSLLAERLALAQFLLAEQLDDSRAIFFASKFMEEVVSKFHAVWQITSDEIEEWYASVCMVGSTTQGVKWRRFGSEQRTPTPEMRANSSRLWKNPNYRCNVRPQGVEPGRKQHSFA
jgi:hypothetical protein